MAHLYLSGKLNSHKCVGDHWHPLNSPYLLNSVLENAEKRTTYPICRKSRLRGEVMQK